MEIKKIIETLRHCGSHQECYNCPLEGKAAEDCMKIMLDAAAALEAAEKRIAELESWAIHLLKQLPKGKRNE